MQRARKPTAPQSAPLRYLAVRARDVVRRRIALDVDAPVALGPIDRARFCRTDTKTNHRGAPGPIFGCVCVIDSSGEALMFTELDSTADHHLKDGADSEYLRMISWLRRTCALLTQPATAGSVAAEGAGTASQPRAARWGAIGRGRQPRHASTPRTPPTGP